LATGNGNIALWFNAGINLTIGGNNIYIGNGGVAGEHFLITPQAPTTRP
jgi:hypothetical protein